MLECYKCTARGPLRWKTHDEDALWTFKQDNSHLCTQRLRNIPITKPPPLHSIISQGHFRHSAAKGSVMSACCKQRNKMTIRVIYRFCAVSDHLVFSWRWETPTPSVVQAFFSGLAAIRYKLMSGLQVPVLWKCSTLTDTTWICPSWTPIQAS